MKIIDYFKKKIIKKRKLFFIKTELDKLPKNNYPFGLYSNPEYFISSGESSLIDER